METLTAEMFLKEMVILYQNRPQFFRLINGYFTPNKGMRHPHDRADKIIQTLQSGQYAVEEK